jgi:hypothetical protein
MNYVLKRELAADPSYDRIDGAVAVNDSTYRALTYSFKNGVKQFQFGAVKEGESVAPETYLYQNDFPVYLGGDAQSSGRNLRNSFISEFMVYRRALNPSEIAAVQGYLAAKWNTAFVPSQILGLSMWLDANDRNSLHQNSACSTAVTANLQPVACWLDKSGNDNHATQSNGPEMPGYNATNTTVSFDGSRYLVGNSDTNFSYGDQSRTIFGVALTNYIGLTPNQSWIMGYGQDTPDNAQFFGRLIEGADAGWSGTAFTQAATMTDSVFFQMGYRLDDTTATHNLRVDGTTQNAIVYTIDTIPNGFGAAIGARDPAGSEAWNGQINEIIKYNTDLSDTDRERVEGYLACKWGIQARLPGGHPYSASCP